MAYGEDKSYVDKLRENLTCSMCLDVFNHSDRLPKVISCQHSFCETCLEGLHRASTGWMLQCPVCRERFRMPRQGVCGIPTNLGLKGLIDVLTEEEEIVSRMKKRPCAKHSTQEVTKMCVTCKTELCAVCLKLSYSQSNGHNGHDIENIDTVLDKLERQITTELLPEMDCQIQQCQNLTDEAFKDLDAWQTKITEAIEGRAMSFITRICQWRDEREDKVKDICKAIKKKIEDDFEVEHVSAIKQEVKIGKSLVGYGRVEELQDMKSHLDRIMNSNKYFTPPQGYLTDPSDLKIGELVLRDNVSSQGFTQKNKEDSKIYSLFKRYLSSEQISRPLTFSSSANVTASVPLIEKGWMDIKTLQVNDSCAGSRNDVVLLNDTSVIKYELISDDFHFIWKKPLPSFADIEHSLSSDNRNSCYNFNNQKSKHRAFVKPNGDIVLRQFPYTVELNSKLEPHLMLSQSVVHSGDLGQLVAVSDNCMLYWKNSVIDIYNLSTEIEPNNATKPESKENRTIVDDLMCQLQSPEEPWTWVSVCVIPYPYLWKQHCELSEGSTDSTTSRAASKATGNNGARLKTSNQHQRSCIESSQNTPLIFAVFDWGLSKLYTFCGNGSLWYSTDLSYTPAPHKSCTASCSGRLFAVDYSSRALHIHDLIQEGKHLGTLTNQELGMAEDEEIQSCLGCSVDGVITLLLNSNGMKRLVAYSGFA